MAYRPRTVSLLLLAVLCAAIPGAFVCYEAETVTWANADERIDFNFPSATFYEAVYGLVMGPGEIDGTYTLRNRSEPRQESGTFKLVTDNEGYVAEYVLVAHDGRERRWSRKHCGFLKDEFGNMWDSGTPGSGSAPIQIYQGLIAAIY